MGMCAKSGAHKMSRDFSGGALELVYKITCFGLHCHSREKRDRDNMILNIKRENCDLKVIGSKVCDLILIGYGFTVPKLLRLGNVCSKCLCRV